jgi:hypothetical protein
VSEENVSRRPGPTAFHFIDEHEMSIDDGIFESITAGRTTRGYGVVPGDQPNNARTFLTPAGVKCTLAPRRILLLSAASVHRSNDTEC